MARVFVKIIHISGASVEVELEDPDYSYINLQNAAVELAKTAGIDLNTTNYETTE